MHRLSLLYRRKFTVELGKQAVRWSKTDLLDPAADESGAAGDEYLFHAFPPGPPPLVLLTRAPPLAAGAAA